MEQKCSKYQLCLVRQTKSQKCFQKKNDHDLNFRAFPKTICTTGQNGSVLGCSNKRGKSPSKWSGCISSSTYHTTFAKPIELLLLVVRLVLHISQFIDFQTDWAIARHSNCFHPCNVQIFPDFVQLLFKIPTNISTGTPVKRYVKNEQILHLRFVFANMCFNMLVFLKLLVPWMQTLKETWSICSSVGTGCLLTLVPVWVRFTTVSKKDSYSKKYVQY